MRKYTFSTKYLFYILSRVQNTDAMYVTLNFATEDSSSKPSKVRGTALPQEYELEAFTRNMAPHHVTWNTHIPACQWKGVKCDDDTESIVTHISWIYYSLVGNPRWEHMPITLTAISLLANQLQGLVCLHQLPLVMANYSVSYNLFNGPLDFSQLPSSLYRLQLENNQFSGNIDLSCLPFDLVSLGLAGNPMLVGTVRKNSFPKNLMYFTYSETNITVIA